MKLKLFVYQRKYAQDILENFKIFNSKPTPTPIMTGLKLRKRKYESLVDFTYFRSLIGNFCYLVATRADIIVWSELSRYIETLIQDHL